MCMRLDYVAAQGLDANLMVRAWPYSLKTLSSKQLLLRSA